MKSEYKELSPNRIAVVSNYRQTFNQKSLKELAKSIEKNGIIEPLIVRENNGIYELIAGERRLKAAKMVGIATVPVIIKHNVSDEDFLKMQLIENMQREDVSYMEEAQGLHDLRNKCDLDISEISNKIGKSDASIYNLLSLLKMGKIAKEAAINEEITKTVAVKIARLPTEEKQNQAAHDLRRKSKDKLVSIRFANKYFQNNFGERQVTLRRRNKIQKQNGNDYYANWKKYLVNFSSQQFEYFKAIVRGRIETNIIAEAVEQVMLEKNG